MYDEIFEKVISIMHNDYSGFKDKKGWDRPEDFRKILQQNKHYNDADFVNFVNDYLVDFHDQHINFKSTEDNHRQVRGFEVRRFENALYVIATSSEKRFPMGTKITALDDIPIEELRKIHHRYLNENHAEREKWGPILEKHSSCTFVSENGQEQVIEMAFYLKLKSAPTYTIEKMDEGPVLLTFTDFANPDAIASFIKEQAECLNSADAFIIDVRRNGGGTDTSYFELMPYVFPEEEQELYDPEMHTMLFNCTERTCDLQIKALNEQLATVEDKHTRLLLEQFKRFFKENRGKGFVSINDESHSVIVKGRETPKEIIILSDVYCGSAGDSFVEFSKLSNKVTVIGRPTAGLNDYSNLTDMKWEDRFELWYPTSKLKRVDAGKGMTGIGIESHLYIPWTPQHIIEDLDMKKALELLRNRGVIHENSTSSNFING